MMSASDQTGGVLGPITVSIIPVPCSIQREKGRN
jgi:hypothetical protein